MPQPKAKIGVIGGSGLYDIEGMTGIKEVNLDTPFGKPSDAITVGKLGGVGIAFLPRHGKGHRILPGGPDCGVQRTDSSSDEADGKRHCHPCRLDINDQRRHTHDEEPHHYRQADSNNYAYKTDQYGFLLNHPCNSSLGHA